MAKKIWEKIIAALKSRTFWTVVVMFLVGGVEAIRDLIPQSLIIYIEGLLGLLASYFRVSPRVK